MFVDGCLDLCRVYQMLISKHWKNNHCFTESYCMVAVKSLNSIKGIIVTLGFLFDSDLLLQHLF